MTPPPQFLDIGSSGTLVRRIAYIQTRGDREPGVVWLCGFNSVMTGTKVSALAGWAEQRRASMLRFDYSGHGLSDGGLSDGTIGQWLEDTAAILRHAAEGPQILVGSSMGGWIALLILRAIANGDPLAKGLPPIHGAVLIAPAWDMTEELIWKQMSDEVRATIATEGVWMRPSAYGDPAYPITAGLIEEGRRHLIAGASFEPGCPVRILQGLNDTDVPWQHVNRLPGMLGEGNVTSFYIPEGDHRLSRPEDIDKLLQTVSEFYD